MIYLEGPNPPDKMGNIYYMTYICCLCHAVLIAGMENTTAAEARIAFSTFYVSVRDAPYDGPE